MKLLTNSEFLDKAFSIRNDVKYLSLYKDNRTHILMRCTIHNYEYTQSPVAHLANKNSCIYCQKDKRGFATIKKTISNFIKEAKLKHGDKCDYSKAIYVNNRKKIIFICTQGHPNFEQTPKQHLRAKNPCPVCSKRERITLVRFIQEANDVHDFLYGYGKVRINKVSNNRSKISIKCFRHGYFDQMIHKHLGGQGCPDCRKSHGELLVKKLLKRSGIKFIQQFKFLDCRYINILSFDFKVLNKDICIEYDGLQHFQPVVRWGGSDNFEIIKRRDSIKNKYCLKNGIKLFRISYKDNINDKMENIIKQIKSQNI
jgi:hypothetical protein